jgi:hypothetical protein
MREVLQKLARGEISVEEAERLLKLSAVEEVGDLAKLDINRGLRKGIPEIVLAEGKKPEEIRRIAFTMVEKKGQVIISRATERQIVAIKEAIKSDMTLQGNVEAGIIVVKRKDWVMEKTSGKVGILTAGTSDIGVAEEARVVAEEMGCETIVAYDVGVAGIHRLFPSLKEMMEKEVEALVVVAGREGALPSLVAGLVDIPIIAVPTSTGYGLGEKGVGALTAMLQACPLGLAVVNIDGGVAAGATAALIANRVAKAQKTRGS